jgi:hypothetical protein
MPAPMYQRLLALAFASLALVSLTGCTTSPSDGQLAKNGDVQFRGFAIEPNAALTIEILDPTSGNWVVPWGLDGSIRAATTATHFKQELYAWDINLNFVAACFDSQGAARVRVTEKVGERKVPTYMFDQAGLECLWSRASLGTASLDAYAAGQECSKGRTEVTVYKSGKLRPSTASCQMGFGAM